MSEHKPPCGHTNFDVTAHQFWDENDLCVRCNECRKVWVVRGEQMLTAFIDEESGVLVNPFGSDSVIVSTR